MTQCQMLPGQKAIQTQVYTCKYTRKAGGRHPGLWLSGCYLMLGRLRNSNASQGSIHHPLTSSYFPEDVYKSVLIQISVLITLIYPRPDLEDFMV